MFVQLIVGTFDCELIEFNDALELVRRFFDEFSINRADRKLGATLVVRDRTFRNDESLKREKKTRSEETCATLGYHFVIGSSVSI